MALYLSVAISVAMFFATTSPEAAQRLNAKDMVFLQETAERQLAEIALGQLALKKASHNKVKQFGAEIIEDHQHASLEMRELSGEEGPYLPVQLNNKHKKEQQRLSRLSGKEFDKAFMAYLLKNHERDLKALKKTVAMLENEKVKHWASAILPTILEVHLKKAESVARAIGIDEIK